MAKSVDKSLTKLSLNEIRPDGWLLDEMKQMADLQRHIGSLPGFVQNGEWISGENLPRYTRGIILLSTALNDKAMKAKAASFLQTIINSVSGGGDFGPKGSKSLTPKIEALKALLSYYECTGSERALPLIKRYFKNQYNTVHATPIMYDSRARLLDESVALDALYRETDLEWLQDLGARLKDMTNDWFKLAAKFPYKKPASKYFTHQALKRVQKTVSTYETVGLSLPRGMKPLTCERADRLFKKQQEFVELDGVNLAKAVKYPAVYGRFIGDSSLKALSLKMIRSVNAYHGSALGMFTSDYHLSGGDHTRGIDVEAAAEMAESLVEVIKETGDYGAVDMLEKIVFNVIPAACHDSMRAVKDLVLVNEVEASSSLKMPRCECENSNAYVSGQLSRGAISVLGAFPTFMQAICMTRNEEINFLAYAPCVMALNVDGSKLIISEKTSYPFRNTVVFKVEEAESEVSVKINFRVPKNVTMQLISGGEAVASGSEEISVRCMLRKGSTFMLKMDIPLTIDENRDGTVSLYKGNLLMSLNLSGESKQQEKGTIGVSCTKKWNVAPMLSKRMKSGRRTLYEQERTDVRDFSDAPFSQPPFELRIRTKIVTNWGCDDNGFVAIPQYPEFSEESPERTFVPFACSRMRIAAFPKCIR